MLADQIVLAEGDIRPVVESVSGVIGCEKIRTRGASDNVFVDLHLWVDGRTPLGQAHALSHVVKDKLMARFPEIVDVVIHIEPPHEQIPNLKSQIQQRSESPLLRCCFSCRFIFLKLRTLNGDCLHGSMLWQSLV